MRWRPYCQVLFCQRTKNVADGLIGFSARPWLRSDNPSTVSPAWPTESGDLPVASLKGPERRLGQRVGPVKETWSKPLWKLLACQKDSCPGQTGPAAAEPALQKTPSEPRHQRARQALPECTAIKVGRGAPRPGRFHLASSVPTRSTTGSLPVARPPNAHGEPSFPIAIWRTGRAEPAPAASPDTGAGPGPLDLTRRPPRPCKPRAFARHGPPSLPVHGISQVAKPAQKCPGPDAGLSVRRESSPVSVADGTRTSTGESRTS